MLLLARYARSAAINLICYINLSICPLTKSDGCLNWTSSLTNRNKFVWQFLQRLVSHSWSSNSIRSGSEWNLRKQVLTKMSKPQKGLPSFPELFPEGSTWSASTVPTMHWTLFFCIALCSVAHVRFVVFGERVLVFELGDEKAFDRSWCNSQLG